MKVEKNFYSAEPQETQLKIPWKHPKTEKKLSEKNILEAQKNSINFCFPIIPLNSLSSSCSDSHHLIKKQEVSPCPQAKRKIMN
jgi:hypothetical protein